MWYILEFGVPVRDECGKSSIKRVDRASSVNYSIIVSGHWAKKHPLVRIVFITLEVAGNAQFCQ
ncbi:MAG: hypothetical protein HS115_17845 [Spirochaetales bacterium]|nr:hypothetical protein [Spirochaetales bacterium]